MKFKLDENLGALGQGLLEAAGHDVMTILQQLMSGAPDSEVYRVCQAEDRILVTLDHDFGETLRFPPRLIAGIVIIDCKGRLSPTAILARIADLVLVLKQRPLAGELWIIEPGRVRIHASE